MCFYNLTILAVQSLVSRFMAHWLGTRPNVDQLAAFSMHQAGRERDKDRRALKGVWICLYLYIGKFPAIRLLSIPTLRGSHSK